jgi:hypothetical protein
MAQTTTWTTTFRMEQRLAEEARRVAALEEQLRRLREQHGE